MRPFETIVASGKAKLAGVGLALVSIIAVALLLAWLFKSCQREPPPKIPVKTQRTIDSLQNTKTTFDSSQTAGKQKVARDTTRAVTHHAAAVQAEASANFSKLTADSLAVTAAHAKTADSAAAAWKDAYDARTREAEQWHAAAVRNDSAYQAERDARIAAVSLWAADTLRRHVTEQVNLDLRKAIDKLQQPCKIIGPIPCPSRTVTMVLSAAAAGTAGLLAGKAGK